MQSAARHFVRMIDKRSSERFDVECKVEVVRGGRSLGGSTRNLSLGGALIHVAVGEDEPWDVGEEIDLSFSLPDLDEPVKVRGKVRWVRALDPDVAGVQFLTGLRARETWALNRLFAGTGRRRGS